MSFSADASVWYLATAIFLLRILDVSIGTMRTISVVDGKVRLSVALGFFEVLVWVVAISQLILRIREHPVLAVAYAGGFAAGNAIGILLERKLALGRCIVRMISDKGLSISASISHFSRVLATFRSDSPNDSRMLVFAACFRRDLPRMLEAARGIDPQLFRVVERFSETSHLAPLPHATGWRGIFKKK